MKINKSEIKELVKVLGFKCLESDHNIYYKKYTVHKNYLIKVDFLQEKIDYGTKIKLGDLTTSNFENSENFVVLEGVDRVLEKGYAPDKLSLEHKWPMGRKEKGKLDILVMDKDNKAYLMIECKTWGGEYEKERKKMQRDGGQLFSYFQQDKAAQYLCLYASRLINRKIEFKNDIVKVDEAWKALDNQKEIFDHWNKNFKDNGIFDEWTNAYNIEIKSLIRHRLKELSKEDSGRIYNQFAEILRHNVVSDKPNAFNKIFNLFLCKIVDEDRKPNQALKFQWLENDTNEDLQKRLSDLYKQGMKEYLTKEVTDYNDEQVEEKLYALDTAVRDQIREMFTRIRLHKNNEFAFKEVYDKKSFEENAVVVREVVELLQPYQIRYGHKQQFLGDFFELLLSTGIKQESGQFFTPVPIAKFIISSLPLRELIKQKIENDETQFLPYIIDYAAGSGHFLTESMDEVQKIINEINESKQRPSVQRNLSSWKINPFDWAYDYIYGIEADYRLVKTAKVSCFLNGDGLANVIHADGLDHFRKSNDYKGKLKTVSKDNPKDNGVFDVVIANPPYSVSSFKNTLKNGEESFDLFKRLTDESSEIECLFIERTKQLLKPGGLAGIILPSPILNTSGIYTDAREIILKYFNIKAIAAFGSNTFMATGQHTVTLFLERRENNEWKKVDNSIKNFFIKPKEATVNGIENAFNNYVDEVFEDIQLKDYISLINRKPNDNIKKTEQFTDYKSWFNGLNEIKNLKNKKAFKDKTTDKQQVELDKLFYDKVFVKEQDRMLYFFLTQPQKTVLIKAGEKQAEKDFIGYEFSSRRGHEGIKMYLDDNEKEMTKLYDDENHLNEEKANSYVYRSFLNKKQEINASLKNNITNCNLKDMIDFNKFDFEKVISLSFQKKNKIISKWPFVKVGGDGDKGQFIVESGTNAPQEKKYFSKNSKYYFVRAGHLNNKNIDGSININKLDKVTKSAIEELRLKSFEKNTIVFPKSGKSVDTNNIAWLPEKCYIVNHLACIFSDDKIKLKYFYNYLKLFKTSNFSENADYPSINLTTIKNHKFPLPPRKIQEKIIAEIEALDKKGKAETEKVKNLNKEIKELVNYAFSNGKKEKIGKLFYKNTKSYNPKTKPNDTFTYVDIEAVGKGTGVISYNNKVLGKNAPSRARRIAEKGNFIISSVRPYLKGFAYIDEDVSDCVFSTGFFVLYSKDENVILNKLMFYGFMYFEPLMNQMEIKMGKGQYPSINKEDLENFIISVININEQKKIMKSIEKKATTIKKSKEIINGIAEQKQKALTRHL